MQRWRGKSPVKRGRSEEGQRNEEGFCQKMSSSAARRLDPNYPQVLRNYDLDMIKSNGNVTSMPIICVDRIALP